MESRSLSFKMLEKIGKKVTNSVSEKVSEGLGSLVGGFLSILIGTIALQSVSNALQSGNPYVDEDKDGLKSCFEARGLYSENL